MNKYLKLSMIAVMAGGVALASAAPAEARSCRRASSGPKMVSAPTYSARPKFSSVNSDPLGDSLRVVAASLTAAAESRRSADQSTLDTMLLYMTDLLGLTTSPPANAR